MTWYNTGTVKTTANSAVVMGTGTAWTNSGLRPGDMLLIGYNTISPRPFEIKSIDSATQITLVIAFPVDVTAAAYVSIPMLSGDRTAITMTLAQQVTKAFADNQAMQAVWQAFYSGSGSVTLTMPDGSTVTGSSFLKLTADMAGKASSGSNSDIKSLSGLTTALSIAQGGTGAKTADEARNSLGLTKGASVGNVSVVHAGIRNSANPPQKTWDAVYEPFSSGNLFPESCVVQILPGPTDREWGELGIGYGASARVFIAKASYSASLPTGNIVLMELKHDKNTTIDSNGFLKAASPVIEIFNDGQFKTNEEAEGAEVLKVGIGEYLISGITGTNSDAAWGGIDGGFELPKDRNGQALIWIDYCVNPDGSILLKTHHRTYNTAPTFAQNEVDGYENGDPIDIPIGRFVSVRVEMPENSAWNERMKECESIQSAEANESDM